MQITSEDCKKYIVEHMVLGSKPEDWKRISKKKVCNDVIRVFRNDNSPFPVTVEVSQNTVIEFLENEDEPVRISKDLNAGKSGTTSKRTFTGMLTERELIEAVAYAYSVLDPDNNDIEHSPADCGNDPVRFLKENNFYDGQGLTPEITKDLEVVNFCAENSEWEKDDAFSGCGSIVGVHTLPNGFTFFGFVAGGDWEIPLFYIIYWDGVRFRAYIPTDGNHFNTDTMTAYGSEGESSGMRNKDAEKAAEDNIKKRWGIKGGREAFQDVDMDTKAILADIERNFVKVCGPFNMPKGMADIVVEPPKPEVPYTPPPRTMSSVSVHIMNPSQQVPDIGTIHDRIEAVKKEVAVFVAELDKLQNMELGVYAQVQAREAFDKLRKVAVTYSSVCKIIESC